MERGGSRVESMSLHHAHEHGHDHGHHHHGYSHAPATFGTAFAIATVLNVALVAIQVVYGVLAHSMALLADAGHNAGDVLALVLAWGSHAISQKHPTERYTYGFRSTSIIAALTNATILLVVTGAIAWAVGAATGCRRYGDGGGGARHRHQRRRRRDFGARQHSRPQRLWRVPASRR
jgi:hypothetical protein